MRSGACRLAAAGALAAVAVAGCGGEETGDSAPKLTPTTATTGAGGEGKTWKGDGFAFTYPADWQQYEEEATEFGEANELSSVLLAPADTAEASLFNLTTYDVELKVTDDNIDDLKNEIAGPVEEIAEASDGAITAGPIATSLAGLPGYRFELDLSARGLRAHTTITYVFEGSTGYFLYCQYTKADAAKLRPGCTQIYESLEVD